MVINKVKKLSYNVDEDAGDNKKIDKPYCMNPQVIEVRQSSVYTLHSQKETRGKLIKLRCN